MQEAAGDEPIRHRSGWLYVNDEGRERGYKCQCCRKLLTDPEASGFLSGRSDSRGPSGSLRRHSCEAVVYNVVSPNSERGGEQPDRWAMYQREYAPIQRGVLWVPTCGYDEAVGRLDELVRKYQRPLGASAHVPEEWWLFGDKARFKPQALKWPLEDPVPRPQGKLAEVISEFWSIAWMPVVGKTFAND